MIDPQDFTKSLKRAKLGPVIQVPCSYFKDWLNFLWSSRAMKVIGPVNEALVMGRAAGSYLATGQIPIVAMQNSGFMNSLNALTSLHQIYDIPAFYITTWRGEGGVGKDAPEHDITGQDLLDYLTIMHLPYEVLDEKKYQKQIEKLTKIAQKTKKPVVLVIRKNTFTPYKKKKSNQITYEMNRFDAISVIKQIASKALIVSSTGFPTRDSFAAKDTPDFYIMGSMGHAFEIGLGVAENTRKRVIVLDGDGSSLMHVGGLADVDIKAHKNLLYTVIDNATYESTGGQPTLSTKVNWEMLAKAFGFTRFVSVSKKKDLERQIKVILKKKEPFFLHVAIRNEDRPASQRVSDKYSAPQIKRNFMKHVKSK